MFQKIKDKYKQMPLQLRASLWFLIASFLQKGISAITTPIFTRLLNTIEYGQYNVFNSWYSIVNVFVSLYLFAGFYISGLVQHEETRNRFTSSMLGLTTTMTFGWTILYLAFHSFWNNLFGLTTVQMLAMLLMIWTSAIFQFWAMEQRVDLKYKRLILLTLIVTVAKPALGIILVINSEDKVTARILGLVLVELIAYIGCYIAQMKRGRAFFVKEYWKEALVFAIPLIPHYLSTMVLSGADKIMIQKMVGDSATGIYSLAYSISLMMTLFNTALSQTIDPWIYKQIKEKNTNGLKRIAYPAFTFIAIINLIVIVFSPEIIRIFAPVEYYEAVWVIPPVTMSVFFMFMYNFFAPFEFLYKKTKFIAVATCAGALLNIGLNYVFIGNYGYFAAAYTTLACYVVYALCHYIFMNQICKKEMNSKAPYSAKVLCGLSVIFVVLGFVMMATYNNTKIRYAVVVIICCIIVSARKKIVGLTKSLIQLRKEK